METMSTISMVNQLPSNKQQVASFVADFKSRFLSGEVNPLQTLAQLKMIEKTVAELLSDSEIETAIMSDAEKYNKDELLNLHGCKFEVREVGTKYDYSKTDDTVLFELEKQKAKIDADIKSRQELLKNVSSESPMYNADGIELRKPIKTSKTKVVVTIK